MARIRTIKPEFPQSESVGRLSRNARLCFIMLWTIADDSGRLRGNSRMLASLLYPYDDDAKGLIEAWLGELEAERCILRYSVNGDSFVELCNWLKHQKIDKPSASKMPAFVEASRGFAKPREPSSEDLRIKERIKDQGEDQGAGANPPDDPRETSDAEIRDAIAILKAKYPPNAAREDWIGAEKAARQIVAEGDATWEQLAEGVERYARLCRAANRAVMNPARFFTEPDKPWAQRWPMPITKAQAAQDANVDAGLAWLQQQETTDAAV